MPDPLSLTETMQAVLRHRALYELAALLPTRQPVGRRPEHPAALVLLYGVLNRVYRSGQWVQTELSRPHTWQLALATYEQVALEVADLPVQRHEDGTPVLPRRPPRWEHWRYLRDAYLVADDVQQAFGRTFTRVAVEQARQMGLLRPDGGGSLCHPERTRVIYGDGTVMRPMYRPPRAERVEDPETGRMVVRYPDPQTGELRTTPGRRFDPDATAFHGHSGPVTGNNFVLMFARTADYHGRVVLSVDRADAPGREADAALRSIEAIHDVAGSGIQAVVYDGALRGRRIAHLLSTRGLQTISKVAAAPTAGGRNRQPGAPRNTRWLPLGAWAHDLPDGRSCEHDLAAVNGAVSEVAVAEDGSNIVLHRLIRRQVKRPRRASGHWHFNAAYEVSCPHGPFLAWVSPHPEPGDRTYARPDALRLIAQGEPDFDRLYGIRADAESANSELKRTLLVDRAMSLGWRRQLVDVLMWALLNNALAQHHSQLRQHREPGRAAA